VDWLAGAGQINHGALIYRRPFICSRPAGWPALGAWLLALCGRLLALCAHNGPTGGPPARLEAGRAGRPLV